MAIADAPMTSTKYYIQMENDDDNDKETNAMQPAQENDEKELLQQTDK